MYDSPTVGGSRATRYYFAISSNPKEDITIKPLGLSELSQAAKAGDLKLIHKNLAKRVDINIADNEQWTPLMHAVHNKRKDAVALLLERGADIYRTNKQGWTAFTLAVCDDNRELFYDILNQEVKNNKGSIPANSILDMQDNQGWTPLILAASMGQSYMYAMLDEQGAKVNIEDKEGHTALTRAVLNNRPGLVQEILQNKETMNYLKKALEVAEADNNEHMIKILKSRLNIVNEL
jgi:ankyrin repeat protein